MMRHLHKILLFLALVFPLSGMAQSLEIVQHFKMDEYATVLTTYKNEFGHRQKKGIDDSFPFAVLEVNLEGDERSVTLAKEKITLNLGTQYMVEGLTKEYNNKIVFLISSRLRNVYMECGDGCKEQVIFECMQLQPDRIYYGSVRYIPAEEKPSGDIAKPKVRYFTFNVEPADAIVKVDEGKGNGLEIWSKKASGIASKKLNYGTYRYEVTSPMYNDEAGTFTVSATEGEKFVQLVPIFGWLSLTAPAVANGASVYVTDATGETTFLGKLPLDPVQLQRGQYKLEVQQDRYKSYSQTIRIQDGDTTCEDVNIIPNFTTITLTTNEHASIYLDDNFLGRGIWTGELEYGNHEIETRQTSHQSVYTSLKISEQSKGQSFELNNPQAIYGSLDVDGNIYGVQVKVTGLTPGIEYVQLDTIAPVLLSQLLVGKYKIHLVKDGYGDQIHEVEIKEQEETVLSFAMEKGFAVKKLEVSGENVNNVSAHVEGTNIVVSYELPKKSTVELYATTKHGRENISSEVKGDIGKGLSAREQHEMVWRPLDTRQQYIQDWVSLDVQAKSSYRDYVENAKIKTLVMGQVGYSVAPQLSYGAMVGQMYKGIGWYVNFRSNFDFNFNYSKLEEMNRLWSVENHFFSGSISKSHLVVHGGLMLNFLEWAPIVKNKFNTFGMYVGVGYGYRVLVWETTNGGWVVIENNTYFGNCSFNGGLFGSVCGVTLSVGAAVHVEGYAEVEVGIGYMF